MNPADLKGLFASVARETFRLELRQEYKVPGEEARLAAWRAGEPWPEGVTPWQQRIQELRGRGVTMRRVHLVERPLTEYLRWEIASYQRNAVYGEDIRILDAADAPAGLPQTDYWLFDEQAVVLMHYDDEGRLTTRELLDGDPGPYLAARDAAWEYAQPLAAWCRHRECDHR